MAQLLAGSEDLRVILDPGVIFSLPAAREHVLVLIIIKSVLMLGRRTFGATTPQASLSRRLILNVALCRGFFYRKKQKEIITISTLSLSSSFILIMNLNFEPTRGAFLASSVSRIKGFSMNSSGNSTWKWVPLMSLFEQLFNQHWQQGETLPGETCWGTHAGDHQCGFIWNYLWWW